MADPPSLGSTSAPCDTFPAKMIDSTADTCVPMPTNSDSNSVDTDENMRRQVGRLVADTQQFIDSHLTLFRLGLFMTIATSTAVTIRLSGLLTRINNVEEISSWQFARRKKLRVRMIQQSRQDPSVFYVCHTPFLRRRVLEDKLLQSYRASSGEKKVIAIRPFGIQVDESSEEWVWSNFVSSHRSLTIRLLRRIKIEGSESVASCNIALNRAPLRRDFAQELVSHGYAECIPENLKNYDNGSETAISTLSQRLKKLEAAQKRAQMMQYGIWKNWQEEKFSDRVFSASRRATTNAFKRLVNSIRR